MDPAAKAFCEEFESKLENYEDCCIPGENSKGLPRCLGSHVMNASDPVTGSLFACYWGAKTRCLNANDLVGASCHLHERESLSCEGLERKDLESDHSSCCLNNLGLEFYSGSVYGSYVNYRGAMVDVNQILTSSTDWKFIKEPVEVFWKVSDSPDHATVDYAYKEVHVGNFTEFSMEKTSRIPVVCRVCRYASAKDCWLEYVDRTGRLYRFDVTPRFLGESHRCMGTTIIRDALYKGYKRDQASIQYTMKHSDELRSSVSIYFDVSNAAENNRREKLVVAVMPALTDADLMWASNSALVRTSSLYLSAPKEKRSSSSELGRTYKRNKPDDVTTSRGV